MSLYLFLNISNSYSSMNMTPKIIHYVVCIVVYINGKVSAVFYRNCFPKIKDFSRLGPSTGSHVHRKSGSVKEMVQDKHVVTTHH